MDLNLNRQEFGDEKNAGNVMSREEAEQLFYSWVLNPKLQAHMKQVAALMKTWAEKNNLALLNYC